jgi:hypothetical protein
MKREAILASTLLVMGCSGEIVPPEEGEALAGAQGADEATVSPTGRGGGLAGAPKALELGHGNGIAYHNGPVMSGTVRVYLIWYGTWTGNSAVSILSNFVTALGGSPYFQINRTYSDRFGDQVTGDLTLAGTINVGYSHGHALGDRGIRAVVASALPSLGVEPHAVYVVLTSADVAEASGFCSIFCGWHDHAQINGHDIKYVFVGNPERCPHACLPGALQPGNSPNANPGADGMASVIAHELSESVTDPDLNAWYDRAGEENADKCAWTYGSPIATPNHTLANVSLGGHFYLIQQNWVNADGGHCALSAP